VSASPAVAAALVTIIVVGCGGGSPRRSPSTTASTGPSGTASAAQTSPSCHALTAADFTRVGAAGPARAEQLANSVGQRRTCSDLFIDASGGLVLELTTTPGGSRELAAARETARGQSPRARPPAVPGLPRGFIIGQQLGFVEGGQVVVLSSGYTNSGQPELTKAQLVRLAGIVAHR